MLASLVREPSTDEGTFGKLTVAGQTWETLELPWRDNHPQYSCIEAGIYRCVLGSSHLWSPRQDGRIYQLLDVPDRDLIKIHAANFAGDVTKSWHSELLGCIAPGSAVGEMAPPEGRGLQRCVTGSRAALAGFMSALAGVEFDLEIKAPS